MYIDSYEINKIGAKYNHKKNKREKDQLLFSTKSDEHISLFDLCDLLNSIDRRVNGDYGMNINVKVTMTETNQS